MDKLPEEFFRSIIIRIHFYIDRFFFKRIQVEEMDWILNNHRVGYLFHDFNNNSIELYILYLYFIKQQVLYISWTAVYNSDLLIELCPFNMQNDQL